MIWHWLIRIKTTKFILPLYMAGFATLALRPENTAVMTALMAVAVVIGCIAVLQVIYAIVNRNSSERARREPDHDLSQFFSRYRTGGIPQPLPAKEQEKHANQKLKYTEDPGIFWVSFAGLIVLIVSTIYTRDQAILSHETAKKQLSAYLDIKLTAMKCDKCQPPLHMGDIRNGIDEGLHFTITNTGQTPAYNVRICARWFQFDYGLGIPADYPYECRLKTKTGPRANLSQVITPTKSLDYLLPISQDGIADMFKKAIWMIGFIKVYFVDAYQRQRSAVYCAYFDEIASGKLTMLPCFGGKSEEEYQ